MPNVRRNMLVDVSPQSGIPLTVDLKMGPSFPITTATTGLIATAVGRGGAGGYAYSIVAGSVPPGTTFDNATGKITRTGTLVVGTSYFTVQVQDSSGAVFPHSFAITVNSRLVVVAGKPTDGEFSQPYGYQFVVSGATGTLSFTTVAGTLPASVTLSSAGKLSGTPSTADVLYPFTVRATDSGSGESTDIPCVVTIYPASQVLGVGGQPPRLIAGTPFSWTISGEGIGPWTGMTFYLTPPLPTWMTITRIGDHQAMLSGTPPLTDVGTTYDIVGGGTDGLGYAQGTNNYLRTVVAPQLSIQPKQSGISVGDPGPVNFNFIGATVTNDGTTMNVSVPTGTVTGVTATTPIVSSGGSAPNISHANSGAAAGTYTYATLTINATGHVTSVASGTAPVTSVTATSPIVSSGGTSPSISHATSGVSAGTYTYATVTVNAYGHVTSISSGSAPGASWGSITGTLSSQTDLNTALNGKGGLSSANTWSGSAQFNNAVSMSSSYRLTWGGTNSTLPTGQKGIVSFASTGGDAWGAQFAAVATPGVVNKPATIAFYPTFNYAGDTNPRRAADITAGFTGTWGTEYLDVCVGRGGSSNDGGVLTNKIARFSGAGVAITGGLSITGALSLPGTTSQYVRGDGSLATLPGGSGTVTSVAAGAGMNFGTITSSGSVAMGTPSTCTASTSNSASGTTHTHAISGFLPLTGGTLTGTLTGTTIQASTIKETSDRRLKREITALRDGLAIVRALTPVRYRRACSEEHEVGLIAQDVDLVLPEVVAIGGDGTLAVGYARIVAPLIAAVQELEARLIAAEERIVALEAR